MYCVYDFLKWMVDCAVPFSAVLPTACLFFGLGGWLLFFIATIKKRKLRAKEQRMEFARQLQYTLPQRENDYIRTRLQYTLNGENIYEGSRQVRVRLGYARILLGKVCTAPLTIAERLQVKEMEKTLSLFRGKKEWTTLELQDINDVCAVLLKLAAKYSV